MESSRLDSRLQKSLDDAVVYEPTALSAVVRRQVLNMKDMEDDVEEDGGETQTFLHQHHAGCVLSRLNDLREREELCDITIIVEGRAIKAHRAVLAASSQYFNAMFTAKMSERNQATVSLIFCVNN